MFLPEPGTHHYCVTVGCQKWSLKIIILVQLLAPKGSRPPTNLIFLYYDLYLCGAYLCGVLPWILAFEDVLTFIMSRHRPIKTASPAVRLFY